MRSTSDRRLTAVFAKRPEPGRVKTRLTPPLSPGEAARLAEAMLDDTVARCCASRAFTTVLFVAPEGEEEWFRARYPDVASVEAQRGAVLGERLARAFDACLGDAPRARSLVVVGGDCPLLGAATVADAHAALEGGADAVFVPDADGGYCLVGLKRPVPELFMGVRMSKSDTYARTFELARSRGLSVHELPEHYDVDVAADLERLARDLAGERGRGTLAAPLLDRPTRTRATLRALRRAVP